MRTTTFEKWLIKRWTKAGLLYRPVEGGTDFPGGPIQTGSAFLYETPVLNLPQTATGVLFNVVGLRYLGGPGWVDILDLFGVITTAVGAVANATKFQVIATNNAGTALTAVDLCATLDINGLAAGTSLSITGTLADAMTDNANGVQIAQVTPIHVGFGTTAQIKVNCAGSDGGTGRIKWFLLARTSYGVVIQPRAKFF